MPIVPPLSSLGPRICIFGPSNAGKSTLAAALARHLGVEPTHLDLLYHYPNTDWVPRPRDEFIAAHAAALTAERWVIEGNYMALLPDRMARATGIFCWEATAGVPFTAMFAAPCSNVAAPGHSPAARTASNG